MDVTDEKKLYNEIESLMSKCDLENITIKGHYNGSTLSMTTTYDGD